MHNLDIQDFSGTIVIIAPHMDDETLACGGLIAKLPDKNRIHIIYATDGMQSPAPIIPGKDEISPDLGKVRMQESTNAMLLLGLPMQNLHFLSLPEAKLSENTATLKQALLEKLNTIKPEYIFLPFRYDRHPDHLAVNHVVASALNQGIFNSQLIEYFIYYRYRLLSKRDIRKYIQPQFINKLDISDVSRKKRKALDCYISQTTIYYPWQTRPILTPKLLDEECQNPEYFFFPMDSYSGTNVFTNQVNWIRIVHKIEPILQRWKYLVGSFIKRNLSFRVEN
jgi:LmbE family N-acetylglucosaminyl deacetylase